MVEVQFKNTRKGYYINSTNLPLEVGDMVAVEAAPGHDIGQVTLTGALVRLQMRKAGVKLIPRNTVCSERPSPPTSNATRKPVPLRTTP